MDKFPQAGESSSNTSAAIPSSSSNSTCWELGMGMPMAMEHENYQINVVHDPYHHHHHHHHHHPQQQQQQQQHHQYQYQFHHHHHPSPFTTTTTTTTSSSIWPITSLYSSLPIPPSLFKPSSTSTSFFQIPTTLSPTLHQLPQPPAGHIPVVLPKIIDDNEDHKSDPINNQVEEQEEQEEEEEELGAMKEMMYKIAAMQPVDIDPASIRKPKRRNVRISDDPQSVAARLRRERIAEKIRILQRLVPGGTKLDTASMLDEAIRYVKFLKRQIRQLQNNTSHHPPSGPVSGGCSQQPADAGTPLEVTPPQSFGDVVVGQFETDVRGRSSSSMEGRSSVGMVMLNTNNTTNIANTNTNTTTYDSLNVGPSFTFSSN